MSVLENKIPPPIVVLICSLSMWLISLISPLIETDFFVRVILSLAIFTVGSFFCIAGVVSFRKAKTTVNPLKPETASSLVSSGVYRISRNPMYVGLSLFLVSLSTYLSSPLSIIGVVAFIFYMNRFQIEPEERALKEIFGTDFLNYMSQVRRWL